MGLHSDMNVIHEEREAAGDVDRIPSQPSKDSQTALEFIDEQLGLEADAREILPYKFDTCTKPLGPLRQNVFACLTCNPPPASPAQVYIPAGVCYSCSISCHGDHNLVELFSRRTFVCDCGTTRMQTSCTLRFDEVTGTKGVHSEEATRGNCYNQNFQNRFCGCGIEYDAHLEKGTMYQCLGLGTVESGGCGEDWWHPECLLGLSKGWHEQAITKTDAPEGLGEDLPSAQDVEDEYPTPTGFPQEDDFEAMICYKCVESNPWIKQYAGAEGFLPPVFRLDSESPAATEASAAVVETGSTEKPSLKRKASDDEIERAPVPAKRLKDDESDTKVDTPAEKSEVGKSLHERLPPAPPGIFSLFLKEAFREHLCHCPKCFPNLLPHQQLLEEEDTYEPPLSESARSEAPGSGARSQGTGSLLERGEAALSTMDRVRAIEGVMVYNHLKDKVKDFLKPYAESGKPVGAEDIKAYFEKLRGDDAAIRDAGSRPKLNGDDKPQGGDDRKEQSGY